MIPASGDPDPSSSLGPADRPVSRAGELAPGEGCAAACPGHGGPANAALQVRATGRKGRGIFAARLIRTGEVLEVAPTAEVTDDIRPGSPFDDFPFAHPEDPNRSLIVFGLASLMNHADEPNTETTVRREKGIGWLVELRATREIASGEEVTRRYACDLWFDPEPPG